MNQTPAAILILTSSILAYVATYQGYDPRVEAFRETTATHVVLGLAGLVLGIWGVISLIGACVREREATFDASPRADLFGMFDPRRMMRPPYATPAGAPVAASASHHATPPTSPAEQSELQLSPEVKAQLAMAAHLEGRDRARIIEDALKRYLPRYERSSEAA